jgi:hypothetical protein
VWFIVVELKERRKEKKRILLLFFIKKQGRKPTAEGTHFLSDTNRCNHPKLAFKKKIVVHCLMKHIALPMIQSRDLSRPYITLRNFNQDYRLKMFN